jgi:rare lipoprotein A
VRNLRNDRSLTVRINDRGPFVEGRVIDLSHAAAAEIGLLDDGVAPVRVHAVGAADARGRCDG